MHSQGITTRIFGEKQVCNRKCEGEFHHGISNGKSCNYSLPSKVGGGAHAHLATPTPTVVILTTGKLVESNF